MAEMASHRALTMILTGQQIGKRETDEKWMV